MFVSHFSSFLFYLYVSAEIQLKNCLAWDKLFGNHKYVGSCVFIAHFEFVHTTPHLTHNPSHNTNTNQPCRPIILTSLVLPLILLALLPAIVAAIGMNIPFVVRLYSWTSWFVFVMRWSTSQVVPIVDRVGSSWPSLCIGQPTGLMPVTLASSLSTCSF